EPLITTKMPFAKKPKTNMPCTWVKPQLVCEVKFGEWTQDNILRQPIFLGLREDKDPKEVRREKPVAVDHDTIEKENAADEQKPEKHKEMPTKNPTKKAAKKATSKTPSATDNLLDDASKEQVVIVNKRELTLTNLDKIYWPDDKISKRDMLNYYHRMAPYILPYLKDRPQSLNRLPNGINKPGFYQKDVTGKVADWIQRHDYEVEGEQKEYMVCTDEATLLYMANLGCIEMNPWHSTTGKPDNP